MANRKIGPLSYLMFPFLSMLLKGDGSMTASKEEKKKKPPKLHKALWFPALIIYGHMLMVWEIGRYLGYTILFLFRVAFWLVPGFKRLLDRWYYKHHNAGFWEYHHKLSPLMAADYRIEVMTRAADYRMEVMTAVTIVGYWALLNILGEILWPTLGPVLGKEKPSQALFFIGGVSISFYDLFLGSFFLLFVCVTFLGYILTWDDGHIAYIEEFEHRFSRREKFLISFFGALPMWILFLLTFFFPLFLVAERLSGYFGVVLFPHY